MNSEIINRLKIPGRFGFIRVASMLFAAAIIGVMGVPMFASAALYRQLDIGSRGSDVSELQTFLALDPTIYPEGIVSGYFGPLTKAAVSKFQSRNGIDSVGRVGPITLTALMSQMGTGSNTGRDISAPIIMNVNVVLGTSTSTTAIMTNTTGTSTPSVTTSTSTPVTVTSTTTPPLTNTVVSRNVTISWMTNELSQGRVYFDIVPIRLSNTFDDTGIDLMEPTISGTLAPYDALQRTSHAVTINNLMPNTTYYYLIEALDSSRNVSITTPASFRTAQ